jgi:hypothetical protein
MLKRHYPEPHRLICITDDTNGLSTEIESFPLPVTGFEHLPNPAEKKFKSKQFPSCYRRLWVFSEEAKVLGDRIFCLDIDVVITGSLLPLAQKDATFVGWCDPRFGWNKIAGGAYMLTTGMHRDVWTDFDPIESPRVAEAAGFNGSDQAWMSYKLYPPTQHWSSRDGMTKINWLPKGRLMEQTRFVFTSGHTPPWHLSVQRQHPWITQHWRE